MAHCSIYASIAHASKKEDSHLQKNNPRKRFISLSFPIKECKTKKKILKKNLTLNRLKGGYDFPFAHV
ncbi:hypothetical protein A0128_06440 [Leptospira tipperaryensis]|uniref:Uncharacterized protein n=1 Tax=Leptospira tipperaryensis TaxID=2564040 RepID=A0A1D7UVF1_9LEPT|nr:hypothetical protein A0128_06440 [Leptospira tipperaryensis]